ncbi:MAG: hypothetical protein H8Z69_02130 [Nanohaloarchaea archaeon]|nr:hypothetical protein [Candidatus Nanohaloarchaea archaeon]
MTGRNQVERQLQESVLDRTGELCFYASEAERALDRYLKTRKQPYGRTAHEMLGKTDDLLFYADNLMIEAEERDGVTLIEPFTSELPSNRELRYMHESDELEGVVTQLLESIKEESEELYMKAVSIPSYRDLRRQIDAEQQREERREIEEEMLGTARELRFYNSILEHISRTSNSFNIEAALEEAERNTEKGWQAYKKGIGHFSDLSDYRRRNNLEAGNRFVNPDKAGSPSNAENIEKRSESFGEQELSRQMEEFFDTLKRSENLISTNPLDKLDDSEIL